MGSAAEAPAAADAGQQPRVNGTVAPGYEPVRQAFLQHVKDGLEDGAQLCAYHKGVMVVDLWTDKEDYGPSTVQNLFSSTKVLTSLVVAMLADRGHLDYNQKVCDVWPAYAQHGKGETTIAHVMRHEAGLSELDCQFDASDLTAERIREGSISDRLAAQRPRHTPGEKREYHAVTRGWLVNEIVRRVDPEGRTIGQFLHEEVALPLGLENELCVGLPEEMTSHVRDLKFQHLWWTWGQLLLPRWLGGGKVPVKDGTLRGFLLAGLPIFAAASAVKKMRGTGTSDFPVTVQDPDVRAGETATDLFNCSEMRRCEVPSANGHASARALALVAATIVEGGALTEAEEGEEGPEGSHRLLSSEGVEAAHAAPVKMTMGPLPTSFTNAGWNLFEDRRYGFVGWGGLGGSVVQWHREERVGVGYAMNLLEYSPANDRARVLQQAILACVRAVTAEEAAA